MDIEFYLKLLLIFFVFFLTYRFQADNRRTKE